MPSDGILPYSMLSPEVSMSVSGPEASESYLNRVKEDILRLDALAERVARETSRLKSHINELASPISRLPVEVLSEIFTYAAPRGAKPHQETQRELLSPFFLGAVCKRWREVAWSAPSIWTDISVFISRASRYPIQVELLEEWLQRSKGLPLTIRLRWNSRTPLYPMEHYTPERAQRDDPEGIIQLLLGHAEQWEHIDFFLYIYWFHHFEDCTLGLPRLKTAALRRLDHPAEHPEWHTLDILENAPNLRQLELTGFKSRDISLNWSALKNLVVIDNTVIDTQHMMDEATNVEMICLGNIQDDDNLPGGAPPRESITLPNLHSFGLSESPGDIFDKIIGRLTLPTVQFLRLHTERPFFFIGSPTTPIPSFKRWSAKWSSTLTVIYLERGLSNTPEVLEALASFKSLEEVQITDTGGTNWSLDMRELAHALIGTKYGQFLPNLHKFKYAGEVSNIVVKMIVQALVFRWDLCQPKTPLYGITTPLQVVDGMKRLRSFIIEDHDDSGTPCCYDHDELDELWRVKKEGMHINIFLDDECWFRDSEEDY